MTIMTRTHARRLLKLAATLDAVPRREFDIETWFNKKVIKQGKPACKTVACALGWACSIPSFKRAGLKLDLSTDKLTGETTGHPTFSPTSNAERAACRKRCEDHYDCHQDHAAYDDLDAATYFFGLSDSQAEHLFMPDGYPEGATPKQVARRIRNLVKTKYPAKKRELSK